MDDLSIIADFTSDHKEADKKLVALTSAVDASTGDAIMALSPSGDIAILALFVAHDFSGERIFIDNGTGKSVVNN